jgi:hypothetical protein
MGHPLRRTYPLNRDHGIRIIAETYPHDRVSCSIPKRRARNLTPVTSKVSGRPFSILPDGVNDVHVFEVCGNPEGNALGQGLSDRPGGYYSLFDVNEKRCKTPRTADDLKVCLGQGR